MPDEPAATPTNGHSPRFRDPLADIVYGVGGGSNPFMTLPGIGGVPHRTAGIYPAQGAVGPPIKRGGQLHCEVYNLGEPKEREAYEQSFSRVYTMINAGRAFVLAVDRQFVVARNTWLVYFEWIELFTYDTAKPGAAAAEPPLKPVREMRPTTNDDATGSPEDS